MVRRSMGMGVFTGLTKEQVKKMAELNKKIKKQILTGKDNGGVNMGKCEYCGRETNPEHRLEFTPKFCCLSHSELWHIRKYGVSKQGDGENDNRSV